MIEKLGKVLLWILCFIAVCILIKFLLLPLFVANTVVNSAGGVVTKTLDADNVIQNYEWFKQQYQDYLALKEKVSIADSAVARFKFEAGERKNWTFEDKGEYTRLQIISDGLKYQLKDLIAQYNAKSEMENRNLFKSKNLPPVLE